jgi:hypothetical protein
MSNLLRFHAADMKFMPVCATLGPVNTSGKFLEGPLDVTAKAKRGCRDDPFREHVNADVVWAWFDAPRATTLHLGRLRAGAAHACGAF